MLKEPVRFLKLSMLVSDFKINARNPMVISRSTCLGSYNGSHTGAFEHATAIDRDANCEHGSFRRHMRSALLV